MAIHANDPEFGVKKSADELKYTDPMSVVYGVTPDNKFIPVRVNDSGELHIGSSITLEPGDLQIGAVEIKNHDTDDRVAVNTDHELIVQSRVHDGSGANEITSTTVSLKQGLDVNVIGGSALSVSEDEDGDVPANQSSVGLLINLNYGYDGISWKRINATSNALHVDVQSSVLPTGASTEATLSSLESKDFATETTLASLNAKDFATETTLATLLTEATFTSRINTLGQKTSALSTPIVIASDQSAFPINLQDGSGIALTSTLVGADQALDVNIVAGAGGPTDTDDDAVAGGQTSTLNIGLNYGWDGVDWQRINAASGRLVVDGSQVTQPISAASLPLPTGAATEATLSTLLTEATFAAEDFATETTLASLNAKDFATETTLSSINTNIDVLLSTRATESTLLGLRTDFNAVDFATETTLSSIDSTLSTQLDVLLSTRASEATLSSLNGKVTTVDTNDVRQTIHDNLNANVNIQVGDIDVSGTNPVPTTLPDDTTREVGRVLASHNLYVSESYATTDTLSNSRPTNGDFNVQHYKTKNVVVKNVDVSNDAEIEILGSVDGTNLDIVIVPLFTLKSGEVSTTSEERAFTHIRINAKSKVAANSADIETKAYGLGV